MPTLLCQVGIEVHVPSLTPFSPHPARGSSLLLGRGEGLAPHWAWLGCVVVSCDCCPCGFQQYGWEGVGLVITGS